MKTDNEYVLRTAEERGVRFVRLWFADILGILKSIAIPVGELESALTAGVEIDGTALEASGRASERELILHPDPATFALLPWRQGAARMLCLISQPDGTPAPADSRRILREVLHRAGEQRYSVQIGAEVEFFLFAEGADSPLPRPLDAGGYYDLTPLDEGSDFRRRTIDCLEQLGIPVRGSHHEVAPSQHEIRLAATDALAAADAIMTLRLAIKEVARELGQLATLMPKPLAGQAGSGMHLHLAVFDGDHNLFAPPTEQHDDGPLSTFGRSFVAGVLAHADELALITNQWINSYTRLVTGFDAPAAANWSRSLGNALIRIPSVGGTTLELRSPDPGANPYLALALVLAAGLHGVEQQMSAPAESIGGSDAPALPSDLREATDRFERSDLAHAVLGERLVELLVANKRAEWEAYGATVGSWQLDRYLRLL